MPLYVLLNLHPINNGMVEFKVISHGAFLCNILQHCATLDTLELGNFRGVPTRTLHYDVFQLAKAGFVQKMDVTRGVVYTVHE